VKKIRAWIEEVRERKNVEYKDLDRIIQRCLKGFGDLFPAYKCTKDGSRTVHHFNVPFVHPISIEKPHGSREFIPRRYAQMIIEGLDEVANYIESNSEEPNDDSDDGSNSEDNPR
jgi:hypothetical protein